MAATSYSALPSSTYVGLGSQGDLLHSANYGTYDTGIGSLTSHPYQYQTTGFGTQQPSYSDDLLQSTYANRDYSTEEPQYYPTDRYAQQSIHNHDPLSNDYTNSQTQRYDDRSTIPNNTDENYATTTTQPSHKTTMNTHHVESNHQHQTSYTGATQHHSPPSTDNHPHQSQQPSQSSPIQYEHNTSHHPPSKQQQQHHQSQPPSHSNLVRSEQQIPNHSPKQPPPARHRSPSNGGNGYTSETNTKTTNHPPKQPPAAHQRSPSNGRNGYASETNTKTANRPPKQAPAAPHRSPPSGGNGYASETTIKTANPPPEMKTTKSSKMRAAANKQKEETRDQKQKDGNVPLTKKKSTPPKSKKSQPQHPPTDDEESNKDKSKRNKKQPHSLPKQHKSRRDDYQTEDNNSSVDDDNNDRHTRSKSKKRTALSDPHREKYPELPPVRRARGPPYYDPGYDYPLPPGHPLKERYPYYDDYPPYGPYPHPSRYDPRHRHLYEDAYDVPPYLAGYHDPYDGFFDYEKRKSKTKTKKYKDKKDTPVDHEDRGGITGNETEHDDDSKSEQSKRTKTHKKDDHDEHLRHQHRTRDYYDAPYYDGRDMLEVWRQERNDYLKKKFKPSVHDVLYAQQWMKSDSYLENQRRRALRDSQGYYFPYKKYTLKDYKDLQKMEALHNPYASISEAPLDRKERVKKRQDYASNIEKQPVDTFAGQNKTPRDMPPKKPWHMSNDDPHEPDKLSKRERALEYAKVQVVKHRPHQAPKNRASRADPTERYVNSLFPQTNDDGEGSVNGRNNQSGDDEDDE